MNDSAKPAAATPCRHPGKQAGAILFFTLVALVAMTLAALAMVRSVDTSNLVAGNIALKQGAIQEADRVMNMAFACLDSGGALLAVDLKTNQLATCNYYASLQLDANPPFGIPDALEGIAGVPDPLTRNTSTFVIERMCNVAGDWSDTTCVASPFGKPVSAGGDPDDPKIPPTQALYRISVKVSGPRNVASYSQMVMNAGI